MNTSELTALLRERFAAPEQIDAAKGESVPA